MKLDQRETGTILAALRHWQRTGDKACEFDMMLCDIATHGDEVEPLSNEEIDALCERINCGGGK